MNILFLHHNFPAQFRHLAEKMAASPANNVVFLSEHKRADIIIPKVKHFIVKLKNSSITTRPELQEFDSHLSRSEAFANALLALKQKGFKPDIIYDHPGWGASLYIKDIFPEVPYLSFFEWFYTKEADYSFWGKGIERPPSHFAKNRIRNLCQLNALSECDAAITPTYWQKSTYPYDFREKLTVIHDGINTDFFSPARVASSLKIKGLNLDGATEIVTYVSRGLEPYRGFPQFFRSIPNILNKRAGCHIVIMGEDCTRYGAPRSDGKTYRQVMQEEIPIDNSRVHFIGFRPYKEYLNLLQASSVHVYLTAPFVLSWSMLEAMSCGCLVVGSDTPPVQEVITHGENGFLVNFWDSLALSEQVIVALKKRQRYLNICMNARESILDKYDLSKLLPRHEQVVTDCVMKAGKAL